MAYTAYDLVRPNASITGASNTADAFEIRYGSYLQRTQIDGSTGSILVRAIDENTIQVEGLLNGNVWAQFTVSGNRVTLNSRTLSYSYYSDYTFFARNGLTEKPITGEPLDTYFQNYSCFSLERYNCNAYGTYSDPDTDWIGSITESPNGYQIDFSSPLAVGLYSNGYLSTYFSGSAVGSIYYNLYSIVIPKFNVKATDTYQNDKGGWTNSDRKFQASIIMGSDGSSFGLRNLACRGMAVKNTSLSYDPWIGSKVDNFTGRFDWDNKKVYIDCQQGASDITELVKQQNNGTAAGTDIYKYTLYPVVNYTTNSDGTINVSEYANREITGDVTVNDVHHDPACVNFWHVNCGGDLKTSEDFEFTLEPFILYNSTRGDYYGPWINSRYEVERELTHDVTLEINEWGCDDTNGVYFEATITGNVNPDYLDDYEIYIAPKRYSKITDQGFVTSLTNGHANGILLDSSYDYSLNKKSARTKAAGTGKTFSKLVPPEVLLAADASADLSRRSTDFTLYLSTRYNHANLAQNSFHALTAPGGATTGIDDIESDADGSIIVTLGNIEINGSNGMASICTTTGAIIYQGGDASVAVAPGMYIVRAGKNVQKVIVE